MKKNTKKIVTAAGIAAGTAAVASLSAYVTIKALIDTALDREMPKVMEKADKRISGEKSSDEFTNRMESASESLAVQPNETVEIIAHDGEKLVGHYFPCEKPERSDYCFPRMAFIVASGFWDDLRFLVQKQLQRALC